VGRLADAFGSQREALALAERMGFVEPIRWLRVEHIWELYLGGRWQEASALVDELLAEFAARPFWIEPMAHVYRARLDLAAGRDAVAADRVERILELARAAREFQIAGPSVAFAAGAYAELDAARVGPVADELLERWAAVGYGHTLDEWAVDIWYALWRLGRDDELRPPLERQAASPWRRGVVALLERDFVVAAEAYAAMGARPLEAAARLWAAEWLVQQGRRREADAQLRQSLEFWRSVGADRYVREGEALLAASA
jgi:hypothetical protein